MFYARAMYSWDCWILGVLSRNHNCYRKYNCYYHSNFCCCHFWELFGASHAKWEVKGIFHVLLEIIKCAALYYLKHPMLANELANIIVVNEC